MSYHPYSLAGYGARPPSGGFCLFTDASLRTYAYIDGLNLYYLAVKGTPYRWLNVAELAQRMLPKYRIERVKYFTALVRARSDPNSPVRQQIYLRALRTVPNLSIVFGRFMAHRVPMRRAKPPHKRVLVIKTEEKGSDVNLATHLVHDAHNDRFDQALVVSNDTDLMEPIRIVCREIGKAVGVVSPKLDSAPSRDLRASAAFIKRLRKGVLRDSQFPPRLVDDRGVFHKPPAW